MSRSTTIVPPAPRTTAAPAPCGSRKYAQKYVRRLVLCFLVISTLTVVAPFAHTAGAAPAVQASLAPSGQTSLGAVQYSAAAWSCRGVYHVVGRGETIYSIARRYGTTAYRIAVCNGLASYTVYVGQTLLVPTARS
jgi:hypothetical protein